MWTVTIRDEAGNTVDTIKYPTHAEASFWSQFFSVGNDGRTATATRDGE